MITSNDPLQPGYTYSLTAEIGKDFAQDFQPDLSPKEMLSLGIFGGAYFGFIPNEFPPEWFAHVATTTVPDPANNCFKILASQSLEIWQKKGWIHPQDPRGWFQWYCRYYLGRRTEKEDARQIQRFQAISRHVAQVKKACRPGDITCRPRQRQAILHWAIDSRKI